MNRFIATINVGSREQRNAVTELFQQQGWPVWHWMEDVWLLAQVPEGVTAQNVTDIMAAHPLIGGKTKLVFRVPEGSALPYWGQNSEDAWRWMYRFWDSPFDGIPVQAPPPGQKTA